MLLKMFNTKLREILDNNGYPHAAKGMDKVTVYQENIAITCWQNWGKNSKIPSLISVDIEY